MDASGGRSVLQVVQEYLNLVVLPALNSGQKWGNLSQQQVAEFMSMWKSFNLFLTSKICADIRTEIYCLLGAQQSISDAVHLSLETSVDLSSLSTSEGCIAASKNPETIASLEQLVGIWCQQVEEVLAQGSQIRKEADDSG